MEDDEPQGLVRGEVRCPAGQPTLLSPLAKAHPSPRALSTLSKGDAKSRVVKSALFGGGKWQVLFVPSFLSLSSFLPRALKADPCHLGSQQLLSERTALSHPRPSLPSPGPRSDPLYPPPPCDVRPVGSPPNTPPSTSPASPPGTSMRTTSLEEHLVGSGRERSSSSS
jgi:hypothetical protein